MRRLLASAGIVLALTPGLAQAQLDEAHLYTRQAAGSATPGQTGLPAPRLGRGHGRDTQIQPGWFDNPGHVTAFALDTGDFYRMPNQLDSVVIAQGTGQTDEQG